MNLWDKLDQAEVSTKKGFELLPEGEYLATVTNVTITEHDFPEALSFDVEYTITGHETLNGRKAWFSSKIDDESSVKKVSFIKGQICQMAGVTTTEGRPMDILAGCKGNEIEITIKHTPGFKNPEKTYVNAYVNNRVS